MTSLHPPRTSAAMPHGDIEPAHHGSPDDLFLVLRFAAFQLHAAAAMWTTLRQGDHDPFIHARGDRPARLSAIPAARLTARLLGTGFCFSARVRRGLTLAGPQSPFQPPPHALPLPLHPSNLFPPPPVFFLRSL